MDSYCSRINWQRSRLSGAIVAFGFMALVSCGTQSSPPSQNQAQPTTSAKMAQEPAILVGGISQLDSALTGHRGRWVLVNVWATWCRPCVAEMPDLVALHQSLQGKPFAILGVSADFMTSPTEEEAVKKVRTFSAKHKVPYSNVIYSGSTDDLTARFSLTGAIPATILYDPQGKEVERWVGQLVEEDFSRIKSLVS